ncbi:sensor histidine kinase [Mycobacteroides salmoniphilum]|uniref:sensor histidine kinase n=1 Tax=Mycobacteroides salmoniphilum TaxID=404941 RepID=UPI001065B7ED|nr:sensor histidine kinase [Mycobacteroides salmoniphilum]TDZ76323.1 Sensor histidine kinase LiaS [Mycobacteroides salmoniphilum]TDZ84841.1 Sensor histidine kinase LiaS [Mycobacteroides salmoniphilum]
MDDASRLREWHWLWDAYIAGVCGAAVVAVVLLNDRFPGKPLAASLLLIGMASWALVAGRYVSRYGEISWRTTLFVAVPLIFFFSSLLFSRVAVAAIPAIYPILFSALPLVTAVVTTTVVNLVPLGMLLMAGGPHEQDVVIGLAITLLGVVAAPLIGIMVVTPTRQRARLAVLVRELEASRAESARLSRDAGASAEREHLAREIHDTLAQGFTSIVALAQAVDAELGTDLAAAGRHIEMIQSTARENLAEARVMVAGLTPAELDGRSLSAAVARLCDRFSVETGIDVTTETETHLPVLGMAVDVVLLRATQEALANVRKHSRASRVRVGLGVKSHVVQLVLSDNGIGAATCMVEGYGLRGMRARVAQVGGSMSVSPTPGGGVTVTVEIPA